MIYLSDVLGRQVMDAGGQVVGKVADLILPAAAFQVSGLAIKTANRGLLEVAWGAVAVWGPSGIRLKERDGAWALHQAGDGDVWLARDVLDKQAVDTERAKLVRVNAIVLAETADGLRVQGVEIGGRGLLQRLGVAWLADRLSLPSRLLPWDLISHSSRDRHRLEHLHPAQIADIVHDLPPAQGSDLVEGLTDEVAADALEEVHPDRQAGLLDDMAPERAADILEEMSPDVAADVLQDLPEEKAQELLSLMDKAEATDVAELLAHRQDSVGGIMTTDYAALPCDLTAGDALAELRRRYTEGLDDVHDAYLLDDAEVLVGVVTLWHLVKAEPAAQVADLMEGKVVTVRAEEDAEEAARLIARYNLRSLPVMDAESRLLGIVTSEAALSLLAPESWRQKPERM
jgi:magnesium transporter